MLTAAASQASADPWKDESGHGRGWSDGPADRGWHRGPGSVIIHGERAAPPQVVGGCRTERRSEPSGEYREETDCYPGPAYVPRGTVSVLPPRLPPLTIVIPLD